MRIISFSGYRRWELLEAYFYHNWSQHELGLIVYLWLLTLLNWCKSRLCGSNPPL
jgi:hypothetical protein